MADVDQDRGDGDRNHNGGDADGDGDQNPQDDREILASKVTGEVKWFNVKVSGSTSLLTWLN